MLYNPSVFLTSILLMAAVGGGTLLTFLYQGQSSITLRLAMGASTGLTLFATFGFLRSSFLGLTVTGVVLSGVVMLCPLLVLVKAQYRQQMREELRFVIQQVREGKILWTILLYASLALVLGLVFSRSMVERPEGIYTEASNNLGDLPFHLQVINSLVYGQNIPVEDPTYTGAPFTYPVLADFLTAMLVRAGAPVAAAIWMQNMVLALAFIGLLHHWTRALTSDRVAAMFAPLLVIFSGGLGWWLLMQDLRLSDGGLMTLLGHLPHDYTIQNGSIFRWGNSLTTLLLPQRSFLFGLPLAVFIFYQWWMAIGSYEGNADQDATMKSDATAFMPEGANPSVTRRMLAAGICAGLLPLVHTHGFVVVMGAGISLALLFRSAWRAWLVFLVTALLIALPEVRWLSHGSAIQTREFIGWQVGWDRDAYNPLLFWLVNTGFFIPLLLLAIFWRRPGYAVSRRLALFYAPFSLVFLVPNFLKLSPWIWDNVKFLFYWYVASVPLVAFLLARLWQQGSRLRWLAAGLLVTLTLSGALDQLRVITGASPIEEFDHDGIAMANLINIVVPPRALVLHAPTWNSPAYLTGRRSLLGYSGWVWSRGLDITRREADINNIYSGSPAAEALVKKYGIDYVLIGPSETELPLNRAFWARCSKLAQIGQYQLYKTDCNQ